MAKAKSEQPLLGLSFRQAVGAQIRKLREQRGVRQEIVALMARRWGLPWTSATVAQMETGRRHLTAEEWLLLPAVLTRTLHPAEPYTWADLIPKLMKGQITLTAGAGTDPLALQSLVEKKGVINAEEEDRFDTPYTRHLQAWAEIERQQRQKGRISSAGPPLDVITDVDRKAGRSLNVPPGSITQAAHRLWNRSLTEEREFRLVAAGHELSSPRRAQALRGAVTRDLFTELRRTLRGMGLRPKPAGRPGRKKKGEKR